MRIAITLAALTYFKTMQGASWELGIIFVFFAFLALAQDIKELIK